MKVAILAGGKGTRLAELSDAAPKALTGIGGRPIIWHIMKIYDHFGGDDFVIALGHKGQDIVDYFFESGVAKEVAYLRSDGSRQDGPKRDDGKWKITLVDTGVETLTGERLKRLRPHLDQETFLLTWCDGLADIDIDALRRFHRRHGCAATVTAAHPPPRFGRLVLDDNRVIEFQEKTVLEGEWINGAFFVLEPSVFDYIGDDPAMIEHDLLPALVADRQLMAFRHTAFWHGMDTLGDQRILDDMWRRDTAPWKVWTD